MLGTRLKQLAGQSAIYGLGGIVSRLIAVFLLPVYTRYLTPDDLGAVGVVVALTAVLVTILRGGISSAFFRFTFDSPDPAHRRTVLRTSFWFTMGAATLALPFIRAARTQQSIEWVAGSLGGGWYTMAAGLSALIN